MRQNLVLKKSLFTMLLGAGALWATGLSSSPEKVQATTQKRPKIPIQIPVADPDGTIYFQTPAGKRPTTLNPELQSHLTQFIQKSESPISAVAVIDIKTGHILALAQGRFPAQWGGKVHSGIHRGFPAASLFKTVVATAAFEVADIEPRDGIGLYGGCANVRATGVWMREQVRGKQNQMDMRRAYGKSCNGFFAKLAINRVGLSLITNFAKRFGWVSGVPSDFEMEKSPFRPPTIHNSSTHTVGKFAAGFGYVGVSAVHAAWMMQVIANKGQVVPVQIFSDTPRPEKDLTNQRIFGDQTHAHLMSIMNASVKNYGGTSSFAYRRGKYRRLRNLVGGKTGTLTGRSPFGITTWFAGMAPLDHPEVAVAAVVVLDNDRWFIKGPNLAAEAFWSYMDLKKKGRFIKTAVLAPTEPTPPKAN
jgi:cell division protein FtsI/penicillin-binding protein 2